MRRGKHAGIKELVTNIYLVPEDYDYKRDIDGNDLNTPPQMV